MPYKICKWAAFVIVLSFVAFGRFFRQNSALYLSGPLFFCTYGQPGGVFLSVGLVFSPTDRKKAVFCP